jgi:hypothetical protein
VNQPTAKENNPRMRRVAWDHGLNLRGGPWSGRSRRATGARGRRRRAPSWAAATRTPRAWTRPSCAAAQARAGAAPAHRHSPRTRSRPSLAPPTLCSTAPPSVAASPRLAISVAVVCSPPPPVRVLPPSSSRVGNGKDAPNPRLLRRAVSLAPAYKNVGCAGTGRRNAKRARAGSAHGSCTARSRGRRLRSYCQNRSRNRCLQICLRISIHRHKINLVTLSFISDICSRVHDSTSTGKESFFY